MDIFRQMRNNKLRIALTISVVMFVYVALRAAWVPFTFDEIYTFLFHVQVGDMQPFYARMDANNHVVNSLAAHLCYLALGKSTLALRLPNVLSFGLFVWYLIKSREFFKDQSLWLLFFASLVFCHFFIDFFNLCRGYGMSMAFMIGCIYHSLSFQKSEKTIQLAAACLLLSLSIWANLSLLVFAVAAAGILVAITASQLYNKFTWAKAGINSFIILLFLSVPFVYAIYYSLALKDAGALYFGSNVGFWHATIGSVNSFISEGQFWGKPFLYLALAAFAGSWILKAFFRPKPAVLIANLLFAATIIGTILLHHILGVKYPLERAALHLIPLFFLALFLNFDGHVFKSRFALGIFPIMLCVHFISTANLSHSTRWKSEAVPHEFYRIMKDFKDQQGRIPLISAPVYQTNSLAFRDALDKTNLSPNILPAFPSNYADFIIHSPTLDRLDETELNLSDYDTVCHRPEIPAVLLARTKKPIEELIFTGSIGSQISTNEYIDLVNISVEPTGSARAYRMDVQCSAKAVHTPMKWWLCTRYDSKTEPLGFYFSDFQIGADNLSEEQTIEISHLLEEEHDETYGLKVYIHNHWQKKIEVTGGTVSVYALR